jgi:sugar lactone lactonase YvrE
MLAAVMLMLVPSLASAAPVHIHASGTITGRLITSAHGTAGASATGATTGGQSSAPAQLSSAAALSSAVTPGGTFGAVASPASSILATVFGSLNQPGLSAAQELEAFPTQNVTPSDSSGAIGPNNYVEMVNDEIAVYSRSNLAPVGSPMSLESFLGGTTPCNPQIRYDPVSERWFAAATRCGTLTENALYIAFSKTNDPSSLNAGWCRYSFSFGGSNESYPTLGLSSNHIIIGANENPAVGSPDARIFSAPKPTGPISSCPETLPLTGFGSSAEPLKTSVESHKAFGLQPATETDSGPSGYVVTADHGPSGNGVGSHIMIWQVGGAAESPTLAALGAPATPAYEAPPQVPQPGAPPPIEGSPENELNTLGGELTQAVAATVPTIGEETIWTQHTVAGPGGESVVRWYELVPNGLAIQQSGTISAGAGLSAFNGAISPTAGGGAVVVYNTGGATQKAQLWAQSRAYFAPPGRMDSPVELASSSTIDSDFSCGNVQGCQWGEYAALSVDPSNGGLVWGSSQINGPSSEAHNAQWATRNFALGVTLLPMTFSLSIGSEALAGPPTDVNANAVGEIWVSSSEAGTVQKFGENGEKLGGVEALQAPCSGHLEGPTGVGVDGSGNPWVTDSLDGLVRKFSFSGKCLLQVGSEGSGPGQFKDPRGVSVDPHANVWVADTGNDRIQELSPEGVPVRQIGPELGNGGGSLEAPVGVAADSHGHVWVADSGNARVVELGEGGEYLGQIGQTNASGCDSVMCHPQQVAVDLAGGVWVADSGNNRIDSFSEKGELISEAGTAGSEPGQVESPTGVTVDNRGKTWVADTGNRRLDRFVPPLPVTIPVVTAREHALGPCDGGTTVTIKGSGFTGASAVMFGSKPAASFTVNSDTSITAVSPPVTKGATVDLTVSTADGTSATSEADHFTYGACVPTVTTVTPSSGTTAGGKEVLIQGKHFAEVSAVKFGSANAIFTAHSETAIVAVSPPGSGIVDVTVTRPDGTSVKIAADQYSYYGIASGDPVFFSNNLQLSSATIGVVMWGVMKFASEALGAEWECVNFGFGSVRNEGEAPLGTGQIMQWAAQGDAKPDGTEARRSCKFKKAGVEGEPEAWITDEPALETTRKAPLSVPWNLSLDCVVREGARSPFMRIGIPSGVRLERVCKGEAEEGITLANEETERKGCYAATVPEGCVKLDMVAPSLGLEAVFEGTVLPRVVDGLTTGLRPSSLEFTGGLAKLHLHGGFASTALASGASKIVGLAGEQLIWAR